MYSALDLPTALAERFQTSRTVDRRRAGPVMVGWPVSRQLRLLDLAAQWPLRLGASHVINTGRRDVCRAWARALFLSWPDADGLWHTSSMTGRPCVTLWGRAADSFPARPDFAELLAHPGLAPWLADACLTIGYRLL
ncbi:MAG: RES domain-containing protein [Frankiaceae bacterium]